MNTEKKLGFIVILFLLSIVCVTLYIIESMHNPVFIASSNHHDNYINPRKNEATDNTLYKQVYLKVNSEDFQKINILENSKIRQSTSAEISYQPKKSDSTLIQKEAVYNVNRKTGSTHLKNNNELHCLALNNYFEARGESIKGQIAVANVVLNRVKHPGFPNSICAVVKQGGFKRRYRCQFSWWCDGMSDHPNDKKAWNTSVQLAKAILEQKHKDITSGALWYHAHYVSPYWRTSMNQGPKIGNHIFYSARKHSTAKTNKTT